METRSEETPSIPSGGTTVQTQLQRIADKARNEPAFKFTSLYHLLNKDLLRECFERLRGDAAAGIDQMTKEQYAQGLEARLSQLAGRLQSLGWRPQPVRRVYIPKPGSSNKQRPLGIPCFEDKLLQAALARILEQIYEQDFVEDSYGFRPGRGGHDALRAVEHTMASRKINWIVEADIKGFFDQVSHEWLLKFLGQRVGDPRVHRLLRRLLKAGVMEAGTCRENEMGVPQGGSISPVLANIYLHYALDLWFVKRFGPSCQGAQRLIRYADDFVACFEHEADARRYREELGQRLAQFGLEVEESKTKVLAFGPRAERESHVTGRKPETFDFLGFTHYCTRWAGDGHFRLGRVTARKKFRVKLAELKDWLKTHRTLPTRELWATFCAKLRGHFAYYGVTGNSGGITRFRHEAKGLLVKWLNRRGGKRKMSWEKLELMEKRFPLPKAVVQVRLY